MNRFIWTLSGATGSGKSFLWKQLTGHFERPVFCLDRVADLTNVGLSFDSAEHLRQYLIASMQGKVDAPKNGTYVIDGGKGASGPVGCTIESGRALLELVWRTKMSCTIVLDEAHNWASQRDFDEHLDQIIREGRHHGISIVACTRRPQKLGKVLIGESLLSVFEHHDQPAQKRAAKALGHGVEPEDLAEMRPQQYRIGGRTAMISDEMEAKLAPEGPDPSTVYRWHSANGEATTKVMPAEL
jgi:hypothetical protein